MTATSQQLDASIDWAEMRALYCKGISLSDLSRKFGIPLGTIKARSSRENWRNTVAKVNEHVLRTATDDLTASAKSWIGRMDRVVHAGLDNITAKGIEKLNLRDLAQALDCVEKANRIARQTYGLDQQQGQTHLHLGVVVQGEQAGGMAMLHTVRPVIDVQSEPVPPSGTPSQPTTQPSQSSQ